MYDVPFILLFFLLISFFIGMYIDNLLKMQIPVFTLIFALLGLIGGIWTIFKRLEK